MREGYVYRIIAPGSNSVYVGQSYDPHARFKQHKRKRDNPKLANWLRKHPDAEIYFWPVIDMDAEEIADEAECRKLGYDLLNLVPCGGTPPNATGVKRGPLSPEHRAKLIAAHRGMLGKQHSPETRRKMSQSKVGKTPSSETCVKISAAQTGRKRGPINAEIRARMSATQKGRILSTEHRAKLSVAQTGKKLSAETRAKISAALTKKGGT